MRIWVASIGGVLGFLLYVAAVMVVADHVLGWHWLLQVPFFAAAGIAWVWPAKWLMIWAANPQRG